MLSLLIHCKWSFWKHDTEPKIDAEAEAVMMKPAIMARRKSVSAEPYDPFEESQNNDVDLRAIHPKSDEQRRRLSTVLSKLVMFSSLDTDQSQFVLDAMFQRKVEAGDEVIIEGDDGDNFYVIESGNFDIFIKDPSTQQDVKKGSYEGSGSFGELALLYNCPRRATIIATTDGSLWAMDRITFRRIIVRNAAKKRRQYEDFLTTVPLLGTLTEDERSKVADAMGTKTYKEGDHILEQGDQADYFYILVEGHVVINRRSKVEGEVKDIELTKCGPGDYFGELALITNKPRAATAVAHTDCTCAVLDVQAFERLLGPCKELLMRNIPAYERQLSALCANLSVNSDSQYFQE